MMNSRFWAALILGITSWILLGVAMFGTGSLYYYRPIAYLSSFAMLLAFFYLKRGIKKPLETTLRPFSMRTNVILVALGSFLIGVVGGITVYDTHWGINGVSFIPSINLSINSLNGALFFGFFGLIGIVFLVIGLKNILWK